MSGYGVRPPADAILVHVAPHLLEFLKETRRKAEARGGNARPVPLWRFSLVFPWLCC